MISIVSCLMVINESPCVMIFCAQNLKDAIANIQLQEIEIINTLGKIKNRRWNIKSISNSQ
jgi:hypothetical protein